MGGRDSALCPPAAFARQHGNVGVDVLDNGRAGVLGDRLFGCCHDARQHLFGAGFKVGEHRPGSVTAFAAGRHPPADAAAVAVLCRIRARPLPDAGRVAVGHRRLAFLAGVVSPHGNPLAGPHGEYRAGGQRAGDERLEDVAHVSSPSASVVLSPALCTRCRSGQRVRQPTPSESKLVRPA